MRLSDERPAAARDSNYAAFAAFQPRTTSIQYHAAEQLAGQGNDTMLGIAEDGTPQADQRRHVSVGLDIVGDNFWRSTSLRQAG